MLLHYLGKLKNQKFAIVMHVNTFQLWFFYHLSNRYLPNVMKVNVKINTMQNTNILFFCLFTVLNVLKKCLIVVCRYGPISDRSLLTLQLTSEESVSRHVSVQMVNILNTFCEQSLANSLHFSCAFGSSGFYPSCQLFNGLMLDGW